MSSSIYRLIYFDFKGRGELIRFLFAGVGVPFQDVRISKNEWPQVKISKLFILLCYIFYC